MEFHPSKKGGCGAFRADHGPAPFTADVMGAAQKNHNFRTAFWTGQCLQMTLMHIPARGEIGVEMHPHTDQFIRVESGKALACVGASREQLDFRCCLRAGDGIFVPAGSWHNICNTGDCPLKLSSIYAPPQHPKGTVHRTKADAELNDESHIGRRDKTSDETV